MIALVAADMTSEKIRTDHPQLDVEKVRACLRYASLAVTNGNRRCGSPREVPVADSLSRPLAELRAKTIGHRA